MKEFVLGLSLSSMALDAVALINGGELVRPDEQLARSTVAIGSDSGFHCSGSVIGSSVVVTAAHCLEGLPVSKVFFALDLAEGLIVSRPVRATLSHPAYTGNLVDEVLGAADIALVKFEGGLPEGYEPIALLERSYSLAEGDLVTLAGFGQSIESGSGVLRKISRRVLSPRVYEKEVLFEQTETEGACFGDSGGPAVVETDAGPRLTGVASRVGNGRCGLFSIYTRPQDHHDFLVTALDTLSESNEIVRQ